MGVKDTATIRMMRQNVFFADAFNYYIYGGSVPYVIGILYGRYKKRLPDGRYATSLPVE